MNPPPPTITRTPLHTRAVTYRGFARSDGLWDIEGRLVDTKDYPLEKFGGEVLPPGAPGHDMSICVTVDETLKIVDIQTGMPSTPFEGCLDAAEPMRRLVGATMGRGWRKTIDEAVGGERGCTHLRELLFNLATAAMQTVPHHILTMRRVQGLAPVESAGSPYFIGKCLSWRLDGPAVRDHFPRFFMERAQPEPRQPDVVEPGSEPGRQELAPRNG